MEIDENTDLGAEIDNAAMRDPTGFRAVQLSVYGYLTYVQESLIEALTET
jgi:cell division ATPase FtsA